MRIRASQLGKIMTSSRKKGEVLSQTAKSYIEQLAKEHLLGVRSEFSSKYTDKGNLVEDDSIELVESNMNLGFLHKNETGFSNDYITGTPDVITNDLIIDVKSSWSVDTFPMFDKELKNKDYYYHLVDTPKYLIRAEIKKLYGNKATISQIKEVLSKHRFNKDTEKYRVKSFLVERDEEVLEQIRERVNVCREYYNTLINE